MRYFIDTEFHEHKRPVKFLGITIAKVWTIDLISIGIVCDDIMTSIYDITLPYPDLSTFPIYTK